LAAILLCSLTACFRKIPGDPGPEVTAKPHGPYRVSGNAILDASGRRFLIRGTHVARLSAAEEDHDGFDPLSATSLITIRQRLNMNAVRLAIDPDEYLRSGPFRARADRLIHLANDLELLVIVEAGGASEAFWTQIAGRLRREPGVLFAPIRSDFAAAIRRSGARQPLILAEGTGRDAIRQFTPHYGGDTRVWEEMRSAARNVPVLVDGLDPQFDAAGGACAAFPSDPAEATGLLSRQLAFFDEHQISWTLSSFTAGHLITDYRALSGTKLDDGWACGKPAGIPVGLGLVLLSHLWRTSPLNLFAVSYSRGGMELARGALATLYGPTLADAAIAVRSPLPVKLGNISVRITDSRGVTRLAPLLYTGAGWSQVNFMVPEECAAGPARLAIVRGDGSIAETRIPIVDVAPALKTASADGRGAAIAMISQPGRDPFPAWTCDGACRAVPIPLARGVSTTVRLMGSGFRFASDQSHARAAAGETELLVVSMGRAADPGNDQLTVRIPDELIGSGEVEFYFRVDGALSNVVRLNFGAQP
jgi:uncharacterized protein (TIGR03437 family)